MPGVKGMNRGNKNRGQGGRLKVDLSLADIGDQKRLSFFRDMAAKKLQHEPTKQEIIDTARQWYYEQDEKARQTNVRSEGEAR